MGKKIGKKNWGKKIGKKFGEKLLTILIDFCQKKLFGKKIF